MSTHSGYRPALHDLELKMADISRRGHLARTEVLLAAAAAATAFGHGDATRHILRLAVAEPVSPESLYEAVLQTYLFAGYPRAINALTDLRAVQGPMAAIPPDPRPPSWKTWRRDGSALCRTIYGPGYAKLVSYMEEISPALGEWMIVEGYGKVLSRPQLDPRMRELCAVASLLTLHVPPQLRAHLRGSLHVGATPKELESVIDVAGLLTPDQCSSAKEMLRNLKL